MMFKKIVSLFVAQVFLLSNLASAVPQEKPPAQNPKQEIAANPKLIVIPREFGLVKSKFTGKPDRLVIHIQDAHCNYEAQTNISKILENLIRNHNLGLVSVEGADGYIDTSWFKAFPDEEVRKEVAGYFMKKGEITGPEYLSITTDYNFKLFGAETRSYYIDNLNAFTSSYPTKDEAEKYLNQIKTILNRLKTYIYSEELKAMDARMEEYETKKIQFNEYVRFLQAECEKQKIPIRSYDNFFKLVSVLIYEKRIDFNVVDKERNCLIDELSKRLEKNALAELVNQSLAFKSGKISSAEYYAYLKDLSLKNGIELVKKYPNMANYIIYNAVYSKIENEKLFKDIKDVENAIKEKLFANDDQRSLDKLSYNVSILLGLVNIKLLNGDFDYYQAHKGDFTHEAFLDFIKKKTAQYGFAYDVEEPNEAVANSIPKLEDFYAIAIKRDKALVDNTLNAMKKEKRGIAVLVTGGFHSEGIAKLLEKEGVSYMVVCPNITKDVPTPYIQILTNQKSSFEDILVGTAEAKPAEAKQGLVATPLISQFMDNGDEHLKAYGRWLKDVNGRSLEERVVDNREEWASRWSSLVIPRVLEGLGGTKLTLDNVEDALVGLLRQRCAQPEFKISRQATEWIVSKVRGEFKFMRQAFREEAAEQARFAQAGLSSRASSSGLDERARLIASDNIRAMQEYILKDVKYGMTASVEIEKLVNRGDRAALERFVKKEFIRRYNIDLAREALNPAIYKENGYDVIIVSSSTPAEVASKQQLFDEIFKGLPVKIYSVLVSENAGQLMSHIMALEAVDRLIKAEGNEKGLKGLIDERKRIAAVFHDGGKGERSSPIAQASGNSRGMQWVPGTMLDSGSRENLAKLLPTVILNSMAFSHTNDGTRIDTFWASQLVAGTVPHTEVTRPKTPFNKFMVPINWDENEVPPEKLKWQLRQFGTFTMSEGGFITGFYGNQDNSAVDKSEDGSLVWTNDPKRSHIRGELEQAGEGRSGLDFGSFDMDNRLLLELWDYLLKKKGEVVNRQNTHESVDSIINEFIKRNAGQEEVIWEIPKEQKRDLDPHFTQPLAFLLQAVNADRNILAGIETAEALKRYTGDEYYRHLTAAISRVKEKIPGDILTKMTDKKIPAAVDDVIGFFLVSRDVIGRITNEDYTKAIGTISLGPDSYWSTYRSAIDITNDRLATLADITGYRTEIKSDGTIPVPLPEARFDERLSAEHARRMMGVTNDRFCVFRVNGKEIVLTRKQVTGSEPWAGEGVTIYNSIVQNCELLPGSEIVNSIVSNSQGEIRAANSYVETVTAREVTANRSMVYMAISSNDKPIVAEGQIICDVFRPQIDDDRFPKEAKGQTRFIGPIGYDPKTQDATILPGNKYAFGELSDKEKEEGVTELRIRDMRCIRPENEKIENKIRADIRSRMSSSGREEDIAPDVSREGTVLRAPQTDLTEEEVAVVDRFIANWHRTSLRKGTHTPREVTGIKIQTYGEWEYDVVHYNREILQRGAGTLFPIHVYVSPGRGGAIGREMGLKLIHMSAYLYDIFTNNLSPAARRNFINHEKARIDEAYHVDEGKTQRLKTPEEVDAKFPIQDVRGIFAEAIRIGIERKLDSGIDMINAAISAEKEKKISAKDRAAIDEKKKKGCELIKNCLVESLLRLGEERADDEGTINSIMDRIFINQNDENRKYLKETVDYIGTLSFPTAMLERIVPWLIDFINNAPRLQNPLADNFVTMTARFDQCLPIGDNRFKVSLDLICGSEEAPAALRKICEKYRQHRAVLDKMAVPREKAAMEDENLAVLKGIDLSPEGAGHDWWRWNQYRAYYDILIKMVRKPASFDECLECEKIRRYFGINGPQDWVKGSSVSGVQVEGSIVHNSNIKRGRIIRSIVINTKIDEIDVTDAIVIGGNIYRVDAVKGGIAYNVVYNGPVELGKSDIIACHYIPRQGKIEKIKLSANSTDTEDMYNRKVHGNTITFKEADKRLVEMRKSSTGKEEMTQEEFSKPRTHERMMLLPEGRRDKARNKEARIADMCALLTAYPASKEKDIEALSYVTAKEYAAIYGINEGEAQVELDELAALENEFPGNPNYEWRGIEKIDNPVKGESCDIYRALDIRTNQGIAYRSYDLRAVTRTHDREIPFMEEPQLFPAMMSEKFALYAGMAFGAYIRARAEEYVEANYINKRKDLPNPEKLIKELQTALNDNRHRPMNTNELERSWLLVSGGTRLCTSELRKAYAMGLRIVGFNTMIVDQNSEGFERVKALIEEDKGKEGVSEEEKRQYDAYLKDLDEFERLGVTSTTDYYFAMNFLANEGLGERNYLGGAGVTGSHNPKYYNGFKQASVLDIGHDIKVLVSIDSDFMDRLKEFTYSKGFDNFRTPLDREREPEIYSTAEIAYWHNEYIKLRARLGHDIWEYLLTDKNASILTKKGGIRALLKAARQIDWDKATWRQIKDKLGIPKNLFDSKKPATCRNRPYSELRDRFALPEVVEDHRHGSTALSAWALRQMGLKVEQLHEEPNGEFPAGEPYPNLPEETRELQDKCRREGKIGVARDEDGDRTIFFDETGRMIQMDQFLPIEAEKILRDEAKKPAAKREKILFIGEVKFSSVARKRIEALVAEINGGLRRERPKDPGIQAELFLGPVGFGYIKDQMRKIYKAIFNGDNEIVLYGEKESNIKIQLKDPKTTKGTKPVVLAGELSGHQMEHMFAEDETTIISLLEALLTNSLEAKKTNTAPKNLADLLNDLPVVYATPELRPATREPFSPAECASIEEKSGEPAPAAPEKVGDVKKAIAEGVRKNLVTVLLDMGFEYQGEKKMPVPLTNKLPGKTTDPEGKETIDNGEFFIYEAEQPMMINLGGRLKPVVAQKVAINRIDGALIYFYPQITDNPAADRERRSTFVIRRSNTQPEVICRVEGPNRSERDAVAVLMFRFLEQYPGVQLSHDTYILNEVLPLITYSRICDLYVLSLARPHIGDIRALIKLIDTYAEERAGWILGELMAGRIADMMKEENLDALNYELPKREGKSRADMKSEEFKRIKGVAERAVKSGILPEETELREIIDLVLGVELSNELNSRIKEIYGTFKEEVGEYTTRGIYELTSAKKDNELDEYIGLGRWIARYVNRYVRDYIMYRDANAMRSEEDWRHLQVGYEILLGAKQLFKIVRRMPNWDMYEAEPLGETKEELQKKTRLGIDKVMLVKTSTKEGKSRARKGILPSGQRVIKFIKHAISNDSHVGVLVTTFPTPGITGTSPGFFSAASKATRRIGEDEFGKDQDGQPITFLDAIDEETGRPKGEMTFSSAHQDFRLHRGVHVAVVTPDDRVIFQFRQYQDGQGKWEISAAGQVAAGEGPRDAASRVLRDELGIDLPVGRFTEVVLPFLLCGGRFVKMGVEEGTLSGWKTGYGDDGVFRYFGRDYRNYELTNLYVVRLTIKEANKLAGDKIMSSSTESAKEGDIKLMSKEDIQREITAKGAPEYSSYASGAAQYFDTTTQQYVFEQLEASGRRPARASSSGTLREWIEKRAEAKHVSNMFGREFFAVAVNSLSKTAVNEREAELGLEILLDAIEEEVRETTTDYHTGYFTEEITVFKTDKAITLAKDRTELRRLIDEALKRRPGDRASSAGSSEGYAEELRRLSGQVQRLQVEAAAAANNAVASKEQFLKMEQSRKYDSRELEWAQNEWRIAAEEERTANMQLEVAQHQVNLLIEGGRESRPSSAGENLPPVLSPAESKAEELMAGIALERAELAETMNEINARKLFKASPQNAIAIIAVVDGLYTDAARDVLAGLPGVEDRGHVAVVRGNAANIMDVIRQARTTADRLGLSVCNVVTQVSAEASGDFKEKLATEGVVLSVDLQGKSLKESYIQMVRLFDLSMKIAYDFSKEDISLTLSRITGKDISVADIAKWLAKRIIDILPILRKADMETTIVEAYKAVKQALTAL